MSVSFPQSAIDNLANISVKAGSVTYSDSANFIVTPSIALISQKVLSANPNRKGFTLYNNGANSVYLCFQGPATGVGCHVILATFATYLHLGPVVWRGDVFAIRNAGAGVLNIVEFL